MEESIIVVNRFYVHIGLHKTGTTTIQNFINVNRKNFSDLGIYVPESGMLNGAHHGIFQDIMRRGAENEVMPTMADLASEIAGIDPQNVLMSSEEFERFSITDAMCLQSLVGAADVRAILYLRRQDGYIISDYGQQVKMGASLPDLTTYISNPTAAFRFNYLYVVGNWWGCGLNKMGKVLAYEEVTSSEGILKSFVKAIDLPLDALPIDAEQTPFLNLSHSLQETDLLRRATLEIQKEVTVHSVQLHKIYNAIYPDVVTACASLKREPLAPTVAQYQMIADQYRDSNALMLKSVHMSEETISTYLFEDMPRSYIADEPEFVDDAVVKALARRIVKQFRL